MKAVKGNCNQLAAEVGPWIMGLGSLNPKIAPYFQNQNFGLKWSKVKKGEKKGISTGNRLSKTIGILVYGKFSVTFPESHETMILEKEGDYVYLPENTKHTYEFLEDSLMMSVRWPPQDDQYI